VDILVKAAVVADPLRVVASCHLNEFVLDLWLFVSQLSTFLMTILYDLQVSWLFRVSPPFRPSNNCGSNHLCNQLVLSMPGLDGARSQVSLVAQVILRWDSMSLLSHQHPLPHRSWQRRQLLLEPALLVLQQQPPQHLHPLGGLLIVRTVCTFQQLRHGRLHQPQMQWPSKPRPNTSRFDAVPHTTFCSTVSLPPLRFESLLVREALCAFEC
jgi:hypothetical protein